MPLVDFLLLTPLDEEWRTVRNILCPVYQNVKPKGIEAITYYLWKQPVNRPRQTVGDYLIVAASMGRSTSGQAHAGIVSTHSVNQWKPGRIVLLGIAGSLEPDRLQLGDVVVSYEIRGYEVGDVEGSEIHFRSTFNQIGALDLDRIRAFRDDPVDYPKWQEECLRDASAAGLVGVSRPPELHIEVTASGEYVVKSVEFGQKLRREISAKISAVEMEARGLHQALYLNVQRMDALMIRGVSDYADENKSELEKSTKDAWRTFAVANAARLLQAMWRRAPVSPLSRGYQLDLDTFDPHPRFGHRKDIPDIEFKDLGTQDIGFPALLNRSEPTPELYLEVTALSESGAPASGFNGVCIIESPQRDVITGIPLPEGGMAFTLPASEWGMRAQLLLSFPSRVIQVKVVCRDEFQRSSEETRDLRTQSR